MKNFYYPTEWQLDEQQLNVLKRYNNRLEELKESKFNFPCKANIEFSSHGVDTTVVLPDKYVLKAFILDIRHFYMQGEPTNFFYTYNILYQTCKNNTFKEGLKKIRKEYSKFLQSPIWQTIVLEQHALNNKEDLLKAFFYGKHFHNNENYAPLIDNLDKNFGPLFKQEFTQVLHILGQYVEALGVFVKNALSLDQLAPNTVAQEVQNYLLKMRLEPVYIQVQNLDHLNPQEIHCNMMDLQVPDEIFSSVVGNVFAILQRSFGDHTFRVRLRDSNNQLAVLNYPQ